MQCVKKYKINQMKRLENKSIFITGGLSGIGKACAIAASNEGASVCISDIKSEHSEEVLDELKKINPKAMFVECDVANFDQVKTAIEKTIGHFGSLDVAINNAGIGGVSAKVGDMTAQDWQQVIGINLSGVFNCMKHELTQMAKQKSGVIVNVSSILGKVGFQTSSHYVAAKHGVIGLTETAALEYATEGIRINALCPGFIETPFLTNAGITSKSDLGKMIVDLHPMKRLGTSEEIAKAFIFLECADSSFMTGASLAVDGGYLAQ